MPKPEPAAGRRPPLLLDRLEHAARRRPAGEGVVEVDRPGVEAHGADGGEPADGARQVDGRAGDGVDGGLLATVALDVDDQRRSRPRRGGAGGG